MMSKNASFECHAGRLGSDQPLETGSAAHNGSRITGGERALTVRVHAFVIQPITKPTWQIEILDTQGSQLRPAG
jgi:hypothetical protein